MAGEGEAAAAALRRSVDDVHAWAIVADEVHVGGGEIFDPVPEVAREVEGLEENFGHHDRGAEVEDDAARELGGNRGEAMEVGHARGTDGSAVGVGMHMDDVGAEGDVNGRGDAGFVRGGEDTGAAELEV